MRIVIDGAAVATVDAEGTEHPTGHVIVHDGLIEAVGAGPAPTAGDRRVDGRGCLVTPGLVNTHHHLYQWATRGLAQESTLFQWLTALYPVWAGIDEEITHAAATAGLTRLARTGCTTAADHHYVFPRGRGDLLASVVEAAHRVGVRLHAVRGSMDRGESKGGLPPDSIVESMDDALAGTEAAIDRYHDPSPGAMVRVAVGPCSPFSVTPELMSAAMELARYKGVRLHTHLAETADEEEQCRAEFGATPAEYAEKLGWLGGDVWLAHGIHLSDGAVRRLGAAGTGVAHCPTSNARLGAGIARVRDLLDAGAPVGLGVDGAASNEDGGLGVELRWATYLARLRGGPDALTARKALWLGTMGGARCLGRQEEIGSLEPGKQADLALWRLDRLEHAGIADPVAALVLGALPPLALLLVGGRTVVEDGEIAGVSEVDVAAELRAASERLEAGR
ncbi:MAG TPA: 8-oxoguanine deaminase [Actinophytocola sp.]|uniref:8-oxoguanine deaminase n=1 Tax=Actinophytocola sp. TaxID=1872138 RepID=UPI002DDCA6C0|nr:8-oxoguanine deaminase [Actinophytocola sp.]HEV2783732.1 8-oxoguanine deaminase [Actinophytocola sp.]